MGKPTRMSPADYRTVRHRLALHTNEQIAHHYGIKPVTVRYHLQSALAVMRCRLHEDLHDVGDLLIVAVRQGVKPLPLGNSGPTHASRVADDVAEPEPAGVGCE